VPDFSGHTDSLHAIDIGSGHSETFLLSGHKFLIDYIKLINKSWLTAGHILKEMRMDDEFATEEIDNYLSDNHITRTQPAPYEHGQNGNAEVLIKHSQETVNKLLDSAQLGEEYWALALLHATDIRELLPSLSNPSISRGMAWGHSKPSLKISPILPFGSRVLAHLPLTLQTALSGRAFPTIYVGRAPGVKGAVKLFNPATKRIILRRTFKVLGPVTIPTILTNIDIKVSGEEGVDQLFYDPLTNSTFDLSSGEDGAQISEPSVKKSGVSTTSSEKKKKSGVSLIEQSCALKFRKINVSIFQILYAIF